MSGSEPWVRRIGHLAALAVAQGILLAACADSRGVARPTGEIRASGSATVSADPDVAVLSLGVGAVRPTVGDARNAAASSLSAVVTALGAAGVDESDFRTASFQIQPRYRYRDDEEEFVGHEVWHFLEVTVRDVASAGDIIDRAVAAGGASIRVQNVDFRVEDTPMLEREALPSRTRRKRPTSMRRGWGSTAARSSRYPITSESLVRGEELATSRWRLSPAGLSSTPAR